MLYEHERRGCEAKLKKDKGFSAVIANNHHKKGGYK